MASLKKRLAHPATATLTRRQVEAILHNMGWEPEDVTVFWRLARKAQPKAGQQ